MNPRPVNTNLLIGGENPVSVDHYCCGIIGLNPEKIPLLRTAKSIKRYPLIDIHVCDKCKGSLKELFQVYCSDCEVIRLQNFSVHDINFNFKVPKGWEDCKFI
jgi:uncharacterized protein (DUF362 family)